MFTRKLKWLKYNWNSFSVLCPTVGNRDDFQLMMSSSVAAAVVRPGDDRQHVDMWTAQVCTLPFSSQQKPRNHLVPQHYHFIVELNKKKQNICFFLYVLAHNEGIFLTVATHQSSQSVGRCLEVPILDYIKGSCWVFCKLDLLGARVDDKCDSSCHCGMPSLMIVLLIEWSVSSCGLRAIKLLHHC